MCLWYYLQEVVKGGLQMASIREKKYCETCDNMVEFEVKTVVKTRTVKGKSYTYKTVQAYCKDCGDVVCNNELIDKDQELFDAYYRKVEKIIAISKIKSIMEKYDIKAKPLSRALGFGDITITRYLDGQIPSHRYSAVLESVYNDFKKMEEYLEVNKECVGDVAYLKAKRKIEEFTKINLNQSKISLIADYIIFKTKDVTHLALQKLLYFSQGLNYVINNRPLFDAPCQAWVHGPIYPEIYHKYKTYSYNPLDYDQDFNEESFIENVSENEKKVIDLVIETFGNYSGRKLEEITHNEQPWINARIGLEDIDYGDVEISDYNIKEYFNKINEESSLTNKEDIEKYIYQVLH